MEAVCEEPLIWKDRTHVKIMSIFPPLKDSMLKRVQGGVVVKIKMHIAVLGLEIQEESPVTSVIEEADQEEGKLL